MRIGSGQILRSWRGCKGVSSTTPPVFPALFFLLVVPLEATSENTARLLKMSNNSGRALLRPLICLILQHCMGEVTYFFLEKKYAQRQTYLSRLEVLHHNIVRETSQQCYSSLASSYAATGRSPPHLRLLDTHRRTFARGKKVFIFASPPIYS